MSTENATLRLDPNGLANLEMRVLDVESIMPYERNPRHGENPEYDRIKDSIRHQGLDQPLVITQRPEEDHYTVQAGGNTRLLILKELAAETGEATFAQVPCLFKPWKCESDVLVAHLRENDLRGNLTFVDKARAVFEAKHCLEDELGCGEMTHKTLAHKLASAGYGISASLICQMAYVVETLLPVIPLALEAGLGSRQVVRIRAIERAARTLWRRMGLGDEGVVEEVFSTLCRRYDGAEWSTEVLRSAMETEIAEGAEMSIHSIRVALDAELKGKVLSLPEFVPIKEPSKPEDSEKADSNREAVDNSDSQSEDRAITVETPPESLRSRETGATPPEETSDENSTLASETLPVINNSKPTDLKSLRTRAWTLAARLAQRNGIGNRVLPLSDKGLGFVLCDVPDPVLANQLDEDTLAQVYILWWQLAACSEMTVAPIEAIAPLLPEGSVLRRALEAQDAELLFNHIWTLDPGHTGYRLWQALHARDWQDLIDLMATYRAIRHRAAESGTAIWN